MKRAFTIFAAVCLLAGASFGACAAKTTVADTLYNSTQTPLTGTVYVTNTMVITDSGGCVVAANTRVSAAVANGAFSIALVPNDGSSPTGTSYTAEFHVSSGIYRETWIVPTSGPVALTGVRALTPPIPTTLIAFSQLVPPSPCTSGQGPQWNGTSWVCASGGANNFNQLAGTAAKNQLPGTTAYTDQPNTFASGQTQNFLGNVNFKSGLPWYDLKAWGGACDGSTDDSTPFSNAQAAAVSTFGMIQLPYGTCVLGAITGASNVTVRGQGPFNSTLKLKNGANAGLLTYTEQSFFGLQDLGLDGNKANQSGTSHCVAITDLVAHNPRPHFENLYIANCLSDGINVTQGSSSEGIFHAIQIYNVDGRGVYDGGHDGSWSQVDIGQSGLQGAVWDGGNQKWTNSKAWFSGRITPTSGYGFDIESGVRDVGIGLDSQDNQASGYLIKGNSHDIDGIANGNGQGAGAGASTYGFYLFNATGVRLNGSAPANGDLSVAQTYALRVDNSTGNDITITSKLNSAGLVTGTPAGNFIRVIDAAGNIFWQTYGVETRYDSTSAVYTQTQTSLLGSDTGYAIDPIPSSGSLGSFIRKFRGVNTSGSVIEQWFKGDGTSTVTSQFDARNAVWRYLCVTAPGTPASGNLALYCDSTNKVFSAKNDAGTVSNTVVPSTAGANQFANSVSAAGVVGYAQPSFSNLSGTATKGQQQAATVYTDQSNTFTVAPTTPGQIDTAADTDTCVTAPGTPAAGLLAVYCDSTNKILSSKNDAGTVSNTVVPSSAGANQFASSVSAAGVVGYTQPAFSNLSGTATAAQVPQSAAAIIHSNCSGTATASSTIGMFELGNLTTTCTGAGFTTNATPAPFAGTAYNLTVNAGTAGVNASSGVVTVVKNGSAQTLTCTVGTATTCTDNTHTFTVAQGDKLQVNFTTQVGETLANVAVSFAIRN